MRPESITFQAVCLCRNQSFHRWLEVRNYYVWGVIDEKQAAHLVRVHCGIKSRGQLATDEVAQRKFLALKEEFERSNSAQSAA